MTSSRSEILRLVDLSDSSTFDLSTKFGGCGPIWGSKTKVWISETHGGEFVWTEFDVPTRKPTGKSAVASERCKYGDPDPHPPVQSPTWNVTTNEYVLQVADQRFTFGRSSSN